mgnify:CR=1 FL=1
MKHKVTGRVLVEKFMNHDIYNIGNKILLTYEADEFKHILLSAKNLNLTNASFCKMLMSDCPNCGNDTITINKITKNANKKFKSRYGIHLFCFISSAVNTTLSLTTLSLNYTMMHKLDVHDNIKIYKEQTAQNYDTEKEHLASMAIYRNGLLEATFVCKVKNSQVYSLLDNI